MHMLMSVEQSQYCPCVCAALPVVRAVQRTHKSWLFLLQTTTEDKVGKNNMREAVITFINKVNSLLGSYIVVRLG